jgi:hypothetical protein
MNRSQFLLLVVTLIVLGGAGAALFWQDIAAYRASGAKIGAKVLPDVKLNDVAQVVVRDAKSQATVLRKDNAWVVQERGAYPANVQQISDMLIKLTELKVVQSESIGASLLPRVDLLEPVKAADSGKPAEGSGTLVEMKDASGKTLAGLILGKVVLKKDPGNPLPNAQDGVPAGRYIRNAGVKETVAVVSDPLSNVSADPGKWLAKAFFKTERIKTLTVAGPGEVQWKIARDEEWGQWKFAAGGGELDASAAVGAVNALGKLDFADVAVDAKPDDAAKPVTVTAETFDNLVYTLKIARAKTDYHVNLTLSGEPPAQRVPEKGEKPEDKEKRDKDFAENRKTLEARIAQEKALGKWTYIVESKTLAPLLRSRAQLVAGKQAR